MARQYGAPPGKKGDEGDGSYQSRRDPEPKAKEPEPSPSSKDVELFHKNAETDKRRESIHHTLGYTSFQASPGDHTHNGDDSSLLLEGYTITGSLTANPPTAVLSSIIQCLTRLGAEDGTS